MSTTEHNATVKRVVIGKGTTSRNLNRNLYGYDVTCSCGWKATRKAISRAEADGWIRDHVKRST